MCFPAHRSAQPGLLVLRVDFEDPAELLAADPDVYYLTEHFVAYSAVLVRLSNGMLRLGPSCQMASTVTDLISAAALEVKGAH